MKGKTNFIDELTNVHIKGKELGKGGQGVVFRTSDPDIAIKMATDAQGEPLSDPSEVKKYSDRFKNVQLLPFPPQIRIAMPAVLIKGYAGYVMRLLTEMEPFGSFFPPKGSSYEKPEWLSGIDDDNSAQKFIHYYETGGLRRRLLALYKGAETLARMHASGLVYGDISHNNIFVSEGVDEMSVWLIDADNIRFEVASGGSTVYTPKYGAPELVQGKGQGSAASDCYGFAIVAFYILSLVHPFEGKKVDGTDDTDDWEATDDWGDGDEAEADADAGKLPWIDDQQDSSNSSDSGLPRNLILTSKLKALFEATFEQGRVSPELRPVIFHWAEALAQAGDTTVECPSCRMSYYYDTKLPKTGKYICPYCQGDRPQVMIVESYRWHGEGKPLGDPCWRYVREISSGDEITLPSRVFDDFEVVNPSTDKATVSLTDTDILVKNLDCSETNLSYCGGGDSQKGSFQKVYSRWEVSRSNCQNKFWIYSHSDSPRLISCMIVEGA